MKSLFEIGIDGLFWFEVSYRVDRVRFELRHRWGCETLYIFKRLKVLPVEYMRHSYPSNVKREPKG